MTVIAAYKGPDGIYVGGDSMAADANDSVYTADPKVFAFNGFTFGYAGSFRFGQILNHCFLPPAHNPILDDSTYMFSVWLESLRETLDSYGLLRTSDGVETIGEDGSALVVYRDNIYYLQVDLSILKISHPYVSIGGGEGYAIGAMHALTGSGLSSKEILEKGIAAAIAYFPRCGGEVTILKHDPSAELQWIPPTSTKKKATTKKSTDKKSKSPLKI